MKDIYLHIDLDGFDPEVAPGVVDEPVPGGLSLEDAERIVQATGERFDQGHDARDLHARARSRRADIAARAPTHPDRGGVHDLIQPTGKDPPRSCTGRRGDYASSQDPSCVP